MSGGVSKSDIFFVALYLFGISLGAKGIRFEDVTADANLLRPLSGIMGHGGAWGDFDGDGFIDLYVGEYADRTNDAYAPAAGPVGNRLFRNLGNGQFVRAKQSTVEFYARTSGALFADLDNDCDLELYSANNCKGRAGFTGDVPQRRAQLRYSNLFRNDGGKLVDVSQASGACPTTLGTARNVGVLDYDADGLLDLLVVEDTFNGRDKTGRTVLFRNLGDLKFVDVTKQVGLPEDAFGLGCAIGDVNGDRLPDIFIAHCNRLFLSRDGKYHEPQELRETFAWEPEDNEDWPCGAAFGDLNRDGRLDLVLSIHHERARNKVFLNEGIRDGVPHFRDVTIAVGLPKRLNQKAPHMEIRDFDNDGWPDLYFSAAWLDKSGAVKPLLFRHLGMKDGLPRFAVNGPLDEPMVYYPAGPGGDFDNDGRTDLFLINWYRDNHSRLLRNVSPPKHWLQVRVLGKRMNRMGIGAKITLRSSKGAFLGFQEITTGYGFASGQPAIAHFGLGDHESVSLELEFPDGKKIRQAEVVADQRLTIEEEK